MIILLAYPDFNNVTSNARNTIDHNTPPSPSSNKEKPVTNGLNHFNNTSAALNNQSNDRNTLILPESIFPSLASTIPWFSPARQMKILHQND